MPKYRRQEHEFVTSDPVCLEVVTTWSMEKASEEPMLARQWPTISSQPLVQELEDVEEEIAPVRFLVSAQGAPTGSEG